MILRKVKSQIRQYLLRKRFKKKNKIARGVVFASDVKIGEGCSIGKFCVLGKEVVLGSNVKIGSYSYLEKIKIGDNSVIESGVKITGHGNGRIQVGSDSYIGLNTILDFSDNINIGNFVHIAGPSSGLWTHTSVQMCLQSIPLSQKEKESRPTAPITIEDNVYIGGNSTIYPGITIHHHVVVAPNSAVNRNVVSYSMVGGVPAKIIKEVKP